MENEQLLCTEKTNHIIGNLIEVQTSRVWLGDLILKSVPKECPSQKYAKIHSHILRTHSFPSVS